MEITYRKCGDYMIPNFVIDSELEEELTRYGMDGCARNI